jgi:hypothetical protein
MRSEVQLQEDTGLSRGRLSGKEISHHVQESRKKIRTGKK